MNHLPPPSSYTLNAGSSTGPNQINVTTNIQMQQPALSPGTAEYVVELLTNYDGGNPCQNCATNVSRRGGALTAFRDIIVSILRAIDVQQSGSTGGGVGASSFGSDEHELVDDGT